MTPILPVSRLNLPPEVKSVRVAQNTTTEQYAVVGRDEAGHVIGLFSPEFNDKKDLQTWLNQRGLSMCDLDEFTAATN